MRVAIFTESFHDINGIGRTYQNMAEYANRKGYHLDIFIPGNGTVENIGKVTIYNVPVQVPIEYYPGMVFDAVTVPRHIFNRLPEMIVKAFIQNGYDVAMLATQGSMGLYAISASRKFNVPLVGSYHTQVPLFAEKRVEALLKHPKGPLSFLPRLTKEATSLVERYYYNKTLFNLAPTDMVCTNIGERFGKPTKVFRRGIDIDRFHPNKARKKDGRTVIIVSRIAVEKNLDMLEGFGKLLPDARLVIVGDGPDKARLEKLIPEAEFKGFLKGEELAIEYASADLFVFPSITETYGNVVQEAMASGLPVILDKSGPSSELVRDGIDGYHYENRKQMFEYMRKVLGSPPLLERMSKNAREAMEARTWDNVFDSVYEGYVKAVNMYNEQPQNFREKWETLLDNLKKRSAKT
ncbi:MAG: glycosyltransferase [Thermoplasmatota archaeon]